MMSHRSELAWMGFESSQKTIDALKEEVLKAEKKLKNVKKSFNFTVSSGRSESQSSLNVITNNQNWLRRKKIFHRSRREIFRKVSIPQTRSSISNESENLKAEGTFPNLDIDLPKSPQEDQPKAFPHVSHDPKDLKRKLVESAISNVMSKLSSTDNSTSSTSNLLKGSSTDGTSTLITEAYQNIDKKLQDVISRQQNQKYRKASNLSTLHTVSSIPKEEVKDFRDTEVKMVAASPLSQQFGKKIDGIEWRIPSSKSAQLPSSSVPSTSGFQKMKQIIDQQRKRQELLNSEPNDNICVESTSKDIETQTLEPEILANTDISNEELQNGADEKVKPPPVRKICAVTTLPVYKGFSAHGHVATSARNFPSKTAKVSCPVGKSGSPKRFKRTVKCSKDLASAYCWKKGQQLVPKVKTPISKPTVGKGKDLESSDSESISDYSGDENSEKNVDTSENMNQTIDLTESPKKILSNILLDDNTISESTTKKGDLDSEEKENTRPFKKTTKSIKRKAAKPLEQKSPAPKIRHYDVNKVRTYIEKKKAERKRRRLEETKKQVQELEKKREQLQQLYDYQKRSVNCPSKTRLLTPVKLPCEKASVQRVSNPYDIPKHKNIFSRCKETDAKPLHSDFKHTLTLKDQNEGNLATVQASHLSASSEQSPDKPKKLESSMDAPTSAYKEDKAPNDGLLTKDFGIGEMKEKVTDDMNESVAILNMGEVVFNSRESESFLSGASGSLTFNSSFNLSFDVKDAELQMVQFKKECGFVFKSEQSKTLKNLAHSVQSQVDDLSNQFQGFLRTKKWIEESPPPPNQRSRDQTHRKDLMKTSRKSIDFPISLKLDESVKSFKERITGIGDTSELYSKITGKKYLPVTQTEQEKLQSRDDKKSMLQKEMDSISIQNSPNQYSLKSSQETSKIDFKIALEQHNKSKTLLPIEEFMKHVYHPDPFNFINTWTRKPLRIPQFTNEPKRETSVQSSASSLRPTSSQKTISSREEPNYSSDFEESDHISESVQQLTSDTLTSQQRVNKNSSLSNDNIQSVDREAARSGGETEDGMASKQLHSTPNFEGSSRVPKSLVISSVHSDNVSDESTIKENESQSKAFSQSDSSISEIVSVVENSKDVSPTEDNLPEGSTNRTESLQKSSDDFANDAKEYSHVESAILEIRESNLPASKSNASEEMSAKEVLSPISSVDEVSPIPSVGEASPDPFVNKGSPVSSVNEASPVPSVSEASPMPSVKEASPASSVSEESLARSVSEASPVPSVELSSCATANSSEWEYSAPSNANMSRKPDVTDQGQGEMDALNVDENASESCRPIPITSTVHLRQQPSVTISGAMNPDSYQMQPFGEFQQEQFIHPHIVARVATEAATAAATSAVIAVLETQKAFLSKKHILGISEREANSPKQGSAHYSSDFESSTTQKTSDPSQKESSKSKSSKSSISEEAILIASYNSLDNSPIEEVADYVIMDKSRSHSKSSINTLTQTAAEVSASSLTNTHSGNHKRKISGNLSSPSPASLSDNDSVSSAAIVTSNTSISSLSQHSESLQSLNSDDSFAQLTLDVVRRMTHEEELRASHQLSLLQFQEKTLVEKARAEMMWLELLKKKLREKGAERKVSAIKKRQKDLILRLRQERIQLRCMQEAYRSICEKHRTLLADKKKLLNEPSSLAYQILNKKEKFSGGKRLSKESLKNVGQPISASSSTPSIATDEEAYSMNKIETTPEVPEALEIPKSMTSNSSQESVIDTQASGSTKSPQLTANKSEISTNIFPLNMNQEKGSSQSNQSLEFALQGLKKLEASKRHLTKREQRIGQRRKHVESLLQWQMKLDSEEMAVRELEQKALELVDHSKKKAKYYVSSSISTTPNEKQTLSTNPEFSSEKMEDLPEQMRNIVSEVASAVSQLTEAGKASSSESAKQTSSVAEESFHSGETHEDSVEEDILIEKKSSSSILDESLTAKSSSSTIQEEEINKVSEISINTFEESVQSKAEDDPIAEEIPSVLSPSPNNKSSSTDIYSESFESTTSVKTPGSSSRSTPQKNSGSQCSTKRNRSINIKLPLLPRNMRRHDSSGSDDSYTISHSETASDQSDIEGRIHALAEELRRRKAEAEKLKREHKKRYREQLKEKEMSLQKQLEAYNHYIQQTRTELEHQLECAVAPSHSSDISAGGVKPQIKSPRIEHGLDSRRLRKQSALSPPEALPPLEKKPLDSHDSPDNSILSLSLSKGRSINLIKKVTLESKEISASHKPSESKEPSESNSSSNNTLSKTSYIGSEIALQESQTGTEAIESDSFTSESKESSKSKSLEANANLGNEDFPRKRNEDENVDVLEDATMSEKSMSSSNSNKTLQNASSHSAESESLIEDHSILNEGSIEEELESGDVSGNFECEGSEGCPTPPRQKSHNQTFVVEDQSNLSDAIACQKSDKVQDKALNKCIGGLTKANVVDKKSETFVMNVVCHLVTSLLDDSIDVILSLSSKCSTALKMPTNATRLRTDKTSMHQANLSSDNSKEARADHISRLIFNKYINDAIGSMINILRETKNKSLQVEKNSEISANLKINSWEKDDLHNFKIKSIYLSDDLDKKHIKFAELSPDEDFIHSKPEFTKPTLTPITGDIYTESIFNKQVDWLGDGFETTKGNTYLQQLEQQILLQQYPYYYRKIPNKPPPPYTPPSTAESSDPLQAKKDKSAEQSDSITPVTENINPVVESAVDVILEGQKRGLSIKDIAAPEVLPVAEELQLTSSCQLIFMTFIFDLVKELTLNMFVEKEEKPMPWVKPRKLTPKSLFITDRSRLVPLLQKEVQKVLKIPPAYVQRDPRKNQSLRSAMKLGRKERDFVDTILISELKDEEPDWVNYDQDELTVKNQIADSVISYMIDDTVKVFQHMLKVNR